MGLLDGLLGNASEVDVASVNEELMPILASNENVVEAYKLIRDLLVFTNKRLLYIDKQGMTGKKVDYHSIPYRAITQLKVETAGHFDLDCDLKIWVSGQSEPIETKLKSDLAQQVQKTLADHMFA
ncbi:PH domain-containing protein [Glaciecola sp. MH2013]|uniref:PH domain-containing protein n=1 Tax=Glaciecola sp. MH2013 TaxID=2785524 RepID=UPI0018A0C682|nr:PH domain-containing protein [Glaciecola sp. MH2013]MBF7075010.1 PH domain-containing protein [Glaciecola sp. MH2013]